jgi:hypothetical protein
LGPLTVIGSTVNVVFCSLLSVFGFVAGAASGESGIYVLGWVGAGMVVVVFIPLMVVAYRRDRRRHTSRSD